MTVGHLRARRREASPGERGETLLELLATVFLLGVVIVGLVTALLQVIIASDNNRRHVRAGNEAVTMLENIRVAPYSQCSAASPTPQNTSYRSVAGTPPSGYTYTLDIRFLVSRTAATSATSPAVFQATCPGAGDQGSQRITITMVAPGRSAVAETLTLIKRNKL
ncbi:MAG: hypothetical protein JWM47_1377 [Acidimicrobiales bacterium]|nr:hypothetical protein [Acidimicrobiales bacterium]